MTQQAPTEDDYFRYVEESHLASRRLGHTGRAAVRVGLFATLAADDWHRSRLHTAVFGYDVYSEDDPTTAAEWLADSSRMLWLLGAAEVGRSQGGLPGGWLLAGRGGRRPHPRTGPRRRGIPPRVRGRWPTPPVGPAHVRRLGRDDTRAGHRVAVVLRDAAAVVVPMSLFSTRNHDGASALAEPCSTIPAADYRRLHREAARHGTDVADLISSPSVTGSGCSFEPERAEEN